MSPKIKNYNIINEPNFHMYKSVYSLNFARKKHNIYQLPTSRIT